MLPFPFRGNKRIEPSAFPGATSPTTMHRAVGQSRLAEAYAVTSRRPRGSGLTALCDPPHATSNAAATPAIKRTVGTSRSSLLPSSPASPDPVGAPGPQANCTTKVTRVCGKAYGPCALGCRDVVTVFSKTESGGMAMANKIRRRPRYGGRYREGCPGRPESPGYPPAGNPTKKDN
jgi:hypothetical protein